METVKIEFVEFENSNNGTFGMQDDIAWPSAGDWQICFFATLKAVPARGIYEQRFKIARQWRFPESVGNKKRMFQELKKRAVLCGFGKIEIFSVCRIEVVGFGLN